MKRVILIVLNNFKNDSRVLKEAISLQNAGFDVQVVALHEAGLKEFETIKNIPVYRIKLKSRNWSKNKAVQLLKYLEFLYKVSKEFKDADIVHCNDLNALTAGILIKVFHKDTKIVYDAHEYEINDKPNQSRWSIRLKYLLEKILIKYAKRVITVSDSIASEYVKLYGIKKPALVLNTPPYTIIEKKDLFRENLGIGKEKRIFLYQGALSYGRGVEILLETFKILEREGVHQPCIVFMGYGPLEDLIKEASRKYANIYFHEAVDPDILLNFTSSADCGISMIEDSCLSYRYSLPNKLFEYIMAEIPVIVSNLPEMKRLVMEHKIGVVAKENSIEAIKEAIKDVLKFNRVQLQENIQRVKKIYNWEEQERVLQKLYKELL